MDTLIDRETLAHRVQELAASIDQDRTQDCQEKKPLVALGILKGSFIFLADLVRAMKKPVEIDFLSLHSYKGLKSSGAFEFRMDVSIDLKGRDVLIIEDIVDSGLTLTKLLAHIKVREPRSLKVCTLLSKPRQHEVSHLIDYLGFEIENRFVVGYGLDFEGNYRQLSDLCALDSHPAKAT